MPDPSSERLRALLPFAPSCGGPANLLGCARVTYKELENHTPENVKCRESPGKAWGLPMIN